MLFGRMRGSFFGGTDGSFLVECADVFVRMRGSFGGKKKYPGTVYCMHAYCIILSYPMIVFPTLQNESVHFRLFEDAQVAFS
jgi:hypothetical protein